MRGQGGGRVKEAMQSVEMEDFSFRMFYNEAELVQKFGHYIIATKETRVRSVKQFFLENE